MATKNYTLGRGKVYLARFFGGVLGPYRYIGNTPEFSLNIESETLDHYSSDEGIREKDDSVSLEVNRTGSIITDNIDPKNVALFFFGSESTVTQTSVAALTETFEGIQEGHSYKLGISDSNPAGYFGINNAPGKFSVYLGDPGDKATGTLTFTGANVSGKTTTIGSTVYTSAASPATAYEVPISGTAAEAASTLADAINGTLMGSIAHPDVTAEATGGVVLVTAKVGGVAGNSISTTTSEDNATWFGASLSGGVDGIGGYVPLVEDDDYTMDFDSGLVTLIAGGAATEGEDVGVSYEVAASTRSRVISGSEPVECSIIYVSKNPKGDDFTFLLPYTKVTPNGDYALKGDEWQQIPLSVEILKPSGAEAIYRDGKPIYA